MTDPPRPPVSPWVVILGGLAVIIVAIWILRVLLGWIWALLKMVLILAVVGAVIAAYISARRSKS